MMITLRKRLILFLAAIVLGVTLLPCNVFAAEIITSVFLEGNNEDSDAGTLAGSIITTKGVLEDDHAKIYIDNPGDEKSVTILFCSYDDNGRFVGVTSVEESLYETSVISFDAPAKDVTYKGFFIDERFCPITSSVCFDEAASTDPMLIGPIILTVDEPYILEDTGVLFSVQLKGTNLPNSLELMNNGEIIGVLADNGVNGDMVSGDGVYSLFVENPVREGYESSFYARIGDLISNSITIYLFEPPTEEQLAEERNVLESLQDTVANVGVQGWTEETETEIEVLLDGFREDGAVRFYSIEDNALYVKLNSGLGNVFYLAPDGTQALGPNTDVQIVIYEMEHFDKEYPDLPAKELDGLLSNYTKGAEYRGIDCNRDAIKKLGKNQVVLWNGHGFFTNEHGPYLNLGEEFSLLSLDRDFVSDCVHDRVLNGLSIRNGVPEVDTGKVLITSKYIDKYCSDLTGSFIFLSACCSGKTDKYGRSLLARSFLNKGATAVCGYSETVKVTYSSVVESTIFQRLMEVDQSSGNFYTLKDAVSAAVEKYGDSDAISPYNGAGASPKIFGDESFCISQAGAVRGNIMDQNGNKLSDAKISFEKVESDGTKTTYPIDPQQVSNKSGKYEVWLPPAKFTMKVSANGYRSYSKELSIEYGKVQVIDITLNKSSSALPGRYDLYSLPKEGGTDVVQTLISLGMELYIVFEEDGTGYYYNSGTKTALTWNEKEVKIDGSPLTYQLNGNELTLFENGEATGIYKRSK